VATLNEVSGVQFAAPSSQKEIVALAGTGGGPPPLAEVEPIWHAENPTAIANVAQNKETVVSLRVAALAGELCISCLT
jgi:hypothetical protein